jgi:hypothetical protein
VQLQAEETADVGRTLLPHIKDGLSRVLAFRPEDPVAFLADYFATLAEGDDAAHRAYQSIRFSVDQASPECMYEAFCCLEIEGDPMSREVRAEDYAQLGKLLLRDVPPDVVAIATETPRDFLDFNGFSVGVQSCLQLGRLAERAGTLFDQFGVPSLPRTTAILQASRFAEDLPAADFVVQLDELTEADVDRRGFIACALRSCAAFSARQDR